MIKRQHHHHGKSRRNQQTQRNQAISQHKVRPLSLCPFISLFLGITHISATPPDPAAPPASPASSQKRSPPPLPRQAQSPRSRGSPAVENPSAGAQKAAETGQS